LASGIERMRAHLAPGGVLVVDGWIRPEAWWPGVNVSAHANTSEHTAAARVVRTWREGNHSHLDMRYLSADGEGFSEASEHHVLSLFTREEYLAAFASAGLQPEILQGPMGPDRDRYIAVAP